MASDLTNNDGMARVRQATATAQTISFAATTVVTLDTVDWDPDNCFTSGGGGGGGVYTAPTDGYYLINGRVGVTATAAGDSMQARVQSTQNIAGTWTLSEITRGQKTTLTTQDVSNGFPQLTSGVSDLLFVSQGTMLQLILVTFAVASSVVVIGGGYSTYLNVIRLL